MNEQDALTILGMADVCYNEGMGPEGLEDLVAKVVKQFPHLDENCHWIYKRNKAEKELCH